VDIPICGAVLTAYTPLNYGLVIPSLPAPTPFPSLFSPRSRCITVQNIV
jgi:hypothetical protein